MTKATEKKHTSKRKPKKRSVVVIEIVLSITFALLLALAGHEAYRLFSSNIKSRDGETHLIYIRPETTLDRLLEMVEENYTISSPMSLRLHAMLMHWPTAERPFIRTGCYQISAEEGDLQFIRRFRSGAQVPVKLTFNNIRTDDQLAARLSQQLLLDSAEIVDRLRDADYMEDFELTPQTAVSLFIPDTYEVYWDITADQLFRKMQRAYQDWWTADRIHKAEALKLKRWEVATLASIVEEETNKDEDKPIVAGLYQNRLRIGMPLQSDPTVKYASGDFGLKRITNAHLAIESPYNTYKYAGLPPGPIRIPTKKTMDYVLNPTKSNYIYMCASDKLDGTHRFTSSYAEHLANARRYQQKLNQLGIH